MRRIKLTSHQFCFCLGLVMLLALASSLSVKTAQLVDQCPKITIEHVSSDDCGAEIELRVSVSSTRPTDKLTYNWSASAGRIISGQGTPRIKVDIIGVIGEDITITVEVDGLAQGCEKTASFTRPSCIQDPPWSSLFDRYGDMPFSKEKERLDNFAVRLQQEPGTQGYIIVFNGQLKRAQRDREYLVNKRGIDSNRLVILEGGTRKNPKEESIDLWLKPTGAQAPEPDPPAQKKP